MRIENTEQLKHHLHFLFNKINISIEAVSDIVDYGLIFLVPGKVGSIVKSFKEQANLQQWDGEASTWFFRSDELNFLLMLQATSGHMLCNATVISLHQLHMKKYEIGDA